MSSSPTPPSQDTICHRKGEGNQTFSISSSQDANPSVHAVSEPVETGAAATRQSTAEVRVDDDGDCDMNDQVQTKPKSQRLKGELLRPAPLKFKKSRTQMGPSVNQVKAWLYDGKPCRGDPDTFAQIASNLVVHEGMNLRRCLEIEQEYLDDMTTALDAAGEKFDAEEGADLNELEQDVMRRFAVLREGKPSIPSF